MGTLATRPGDNTFAYGINKYGQIVGATVVPYGPVEQAFIYSNGTMQGLGTVGAYHRSAATAINDNGELVGYLAGGTGTPDEAFRCSGGTMEGLGMLPGYPDGTDAFAINNKGVIVGAASPYNGSHAFVFSSGTMQDLNSLIDPTLRVTLEKATGINDSGMIICNGTNASGQADAFLLTPVAEPSTLTLLGAGALTLLACVWRRRATG